MVKTIYLNLEDDIAKITSKLKREKSPEVVLVFPKKSFIFSDSINLRLLKKQVDLLGKKVSILTMDEMGQMYAKEAGFELKFLPKSAGPRNLSDIRSKSPVQSIPVRQEIPNQDEPIRNPVRTVRRVIKRRIPGGLSGIVSAPRVSAQAEPREKLLPALERPVRERSRKPFRRWLMAFVALGLVIVMVLMLVVLPSAQITVYAKSQTIARDIDLSADTKTTNADASQLTLPAVLVEENQEVSNTFQTIGKKEVGSKSQGRVAIYNLTGQPITLRGTTTVLSVGSKNYTFNEDQINIPSIPSPTQDQNAPVADITAQGGGETFNLPAGTRLEITNQSFGSQPQRLYAKTVSQVIGGASRFVSVIAKEDIDQAQNGLTKSVVEQIRANLKGRNLTLLDDAYVVTPSEFATDKPEGTEAPSFNAKVKVRIQGLAFDQNQLVKILRERLAMSLSEDRSLQDVGQDQIVLKVRNVDVANGILALSIHYESKAVPEIDVTGVRQQISGKSKQEASEIMLSNPEIERVDITLAPSWQGSIPRLSSKIKLEVKK
jgi:hypothetical protein